MKNDHFWRSCFDILQNLSMKTEICNSWNFISYLSELEHKRNAALHKLPLASSVLQNAISLWSPAYATDGIIQTTGTEIFHSAQEMSPWLMIALQEITTISFLRVYNRDGKFSGG